MSALALESNNLAMSAMHEFKARGFKDFSNKELVNALNAIGSAWDKFNAEPKQPKEQDLSGNKLRTVVLQQIENQNVLTSTDPSIPVAVEVVEPPPPNPPVASTVTGADEPVDDPMDF